MRKAPAQLIVAGACGLTVTVPINGVDVRFECSPGGTGGLPDEKGGLVLPIDPGSGSIAELIMDPSEWLSAEHFVSATAMDPDATPRVVPTSTRETLDAK